MKHFAYFMCVGLFVFRTCLFSQSLTITSSQIYASVNKNQLETSIAINPTNRNNIIVAAINITGGNSRALSYYYTTNTGVNWSGVEGFSGSSEAADPVVAFDWDGTAYYVYQKRTARSLYLMKSSDGGQHWTTPAAVVTKGSPKNVDKPWLALSTVRNQNGKFDITIAFSETDDNSSTTSLVWNARSTDGGSSFQQTQETTEGFAAGVTVAYDADGNSHLAWAVLRTSSPFDVNAIAFDDAPQITVNQIGTYEKIGNVDMFVLKDSKVRVNSYPSMAIDRSGGPNAGCRYVAWADQGGGTPDILMKKSSDNGATWGPSVVVNSSTTNDQWFPSLAVDPDGNVNVIFYDSRNSAGNQSAQVGFARSTDGGSSFKDTVIGSAFQIMSSPTANFMGDYIGLDNWTGFSYPCWMRWDGSKYQAWFAEVSMPTVNVTVKNILGNSQYGSFTLFEYPNTSSPWSSGTVFPWPYPSLRKIRATDRYSNPFNDGTNWKFRDWNRIQGDHDNPKINGIAATSSLIEMIYKTICPLTIKTNLQDALSDAGTVQFRDPLGTNLYENKNSVFYRDDLFTLESPPYGVGALSILSGILGTDWYFQQWSDGFAQQHDITVTGPATYTATYKAHFASSVSTATGFNGQRKEIRRGNSYYFVYQSAGRIWYQVSTDEGATWSFDELVSAVGEGTQQLNPAIDVDNTGTPYVAYEVLVDGTHRSLAMKKKINGAWQLVNGGETFLASMDMKPVIAVTTRPIVTLQANGYGNSNPGLYYWDGGAVGKIGETSSSSINPTLAWYNLAYQDGNAIYLKRLDYTANPVAFGVRTLVSSNFVNGRLVQNISNPSISVREVTDGDRRPVIAWQGQDQVFQSYHPIFVRHPVGNDGGGNPVFVTTVFDWGTSNAHGRTPTVECYWTPPGVGYQNPDVSAVWQDDPSNPSGNYYNVVAVNKINGTWGSQSSLQNPGQYSSVAQGEIYQSSNGGALTCWTGTTGLPYSVSASQKTNNGLPKSTSIPRSYARGININLDRLSIPDLHGVASIVVNQNTSASFTTANASNVSPDTYIRLVTSSTQQSNVYYTLGLLDAKFPSTLTAKQLSQSVFSFQSQPSGTVLKTLTVSDLVNLWTRSMTSVGSSAIAFADEAVIIPANQQVGLREPGITGSISDIAQLFEFVGGEDSSWLEKYGHDGPTPQAPMALLANYPNPFNPSTSIEYTLAGNSHVHLRVFNVLGEEVAFLVDETQTAGRHRHTFDASRLPSAMYFYRLEAGDFTQTEKMMLVK